MYAMYLLGIPVSFLIANSYSVLLNIKCMVGKKWLFSPNKSYQYPPKIILKKLLNIFGIEKFILVCSWSMHLHAKLWLESFLLPYLCCSLLGAIFYNWQVTCWVRQDKFTAHFVGYSSEKGRKEIQIQNDRTFEHALHANKTHGPARWLGRAILSELISEVLF